MPGETVRSHWTPSGRKVVMHPASFGFEAPVRRIGVLGDVHAEDVNVYAALTWLTDRGAERIVCTGDLVEGVGDAERAVRLLREHEVVVVRSRRDLWYAHETRWRTGMTWLSGATSEGQLPAALPDDDIDWMIGLPEVVHIATVDGTLMLCHGVGVDGRNPLRIDDPADVIAQNLAFQDIVTHWEQPALLVKGHSHFPGVAQLEGLPVLDAGTLVRDQDPCVWLLDSQERIATRWSLSSGTVDSRSERVWGL